MGDDRSKEMHWFTTVIKSDRLKWEQRIQDALDEGSFFIEVDLKEVRPKDWIMRLLLVRSRFLRSRSQSADSIP